MSWKILSKDYVYKNKFIRVLEKKTKHETLGTYNFYTIDFPDWVNIVPITKDNKVILVKQYRHGLESYTLETPGGVVDPGEDPITTVSRELLEETGYQGEIISLGKVAPNPAIQGNYCHIYLAVNCQLVSEQNLDGTEDISVVHVDLSDIHRYIQSEDIIHSLSVVSLLKAQTYLDNSK